MKSANDMDHLFPIDSSLAFLSLSLNYTTCKKHLFAIHDVYYCTCIFHQQPFCVSDMHQEQLPNNKKGACTDHISITCRLSYLSCKSSILAAYNFSMSGICVDLFLKLKVVACKRKKFQLDIHTGIGNKRQT